MSATRTDEETMTAEDPMKYDEWRAAVTDAVKELGFSESVQSAFLAAVFECHAAYHGKWETALAAVEKSNKEMLRYAKAALILRATMKRLSIIDGVSALLQQQALADTLWIEEETAQ